MNTEMTQLNKRFPFLTYATYTDEDYIGIVQNMDSSIISIYAYNKMHDPQVKSLFLQYGEIWWWESNRIIPINMFIGDDFKLFAPYLVTFSIKEFNHVIGPVVCTDDMTTKRVKRRSVQLIRKIN